MAGGLPAWLAGSTSVPRNTRRPTLAPARPGVTAQAAGAYHPHAHRCRMARAGGSVRCRAAGRSPAGRPSQEGPYFRTVTITDKPGSYLRSHNNHYYNVWDSIKIQALADAQLPRMDNDQKQKSRRRSDDRWKTKRKKLSTMDASNGVLFVIQPTHNMIHLQRLAAQATIEGIPVILLSPRMMTQESSTWDQSGYQHAAAYGGDEPPTGPTPWLMRDFWPPVYSWILSNEFGYSQSILHEKQSWDIFQCHEVGRREMECEYLASTVNCAGRPTQELLRKIAKEFQPKC